MQNKTTNVLLGVIAAALIVIIALFFFNKNPAQPVAENAGTTTTTTGTQTPAVPTQPTAPAPTSKPYTDAAFGFSFTYPAADTATVDAAGNVSVAIPGSEQAITVLKTLDTAPDSNGKWGPYIVSYMNGSYVAQQQNEQTGAMQSKPITPIAYTTSGLPIFNGGMPEHGFGKYDYIVALSTTKFLTISGPDMSGQNPPYDPATDPTLGIAKAVVGR